MTRYITASASMPDSSRKISCGILLWPCWLLRRSSTQGGGKWETFGLWMCLSVKMGLSNWRVLPHGRWKGVTMRKAFKSRWLISVIPILCSPWRSDRSGICQDIAICRFPTSLDFLDRTHPPRCSHSGWLYRAIQEQQADRLSTPRRKIGGTSQQAVQ